MSAGLRPLNDCNGATVGSTENGAVSTLPIKNPACMAGFFCIQYGYLCEQLTWLAVLVGLRSQLLGFHAQEVVVGRDVHGQIFH